MAISPIQLTQEMSGNYIHFHLDNSVSAHKAVFSTTVTINPFDPFHKELITKINSFDPADPNIVDSNVKFLSIITVALDSTSNPGSVPPSEIRGLRYLEDIPPGENPSNLAVVLTIKDGTILQLLHKPKRTKGKVSNTLG